MENASKALIIAGAILLSILIISLGIMIFQQASEVVDSNAMSELEITQFNQKFTTYMGTNVRGAKVDSLINQVVQNNVATTDTSKQVKIKLSANKWGSSDKVSQFSSAKAPTAISEIGSAQSGFTYDVSYTTNSKTGLIDTITIGDAK